MLTPNAKGYLLAVTLFVVCCWVNPNDAIPYRTRAQATEQVDQRVNNRAERSSVNVAHRAIGQPYLGADKKPTLSGGGKTRSPSQRSRNPRSRIKNVNLNVNRNKVGGTGLSTDRLSRIKKRLSQLLEVDQSINSLSEIDNVAAVTDSYDIPETDVKQLSTEKINCTEPHNENDSYSSSFYANSTLQLLDVNDDFQIAGETDTKKTSSVHIGEDVTLCWIETTTIKEDRTVSPVQRFVIREYTISFENSATIPDRYLECVQLEGEVSGKNNSIPRSALFEVMDENTRHSRVVNFTTVSHSDDLTVWQHKRVRCGVGPVVTKNIIEWTDERSDDPKKRVQIKVSPKIHRLTAQPTDTEPCTTDLNPLLIFTTTPNPSSPVDCGHGMTCHGYSDCDDEPCRDIYPGERSTSSVLQEETTESYIASSAVNHETHEINTTDDNDLSELSPTVKAKVLVPVTDGTIDSSEEMSTYVSVTTETTEEYVSFSTVTPMDVTMIFDDESSTTMSRSEISNSTESGSVMSVTLNHEAGSSVESGNQKVEIPTILPELNYSRSEMDDYCENEDSCADSTSDGSSVSWEDFTNSVTDTTETATHRNSEISYTVGFTVTSTADASTNQTSESTTKDTDDYLFREDSGSTTETIELESSSRITEASESSTQNFGRIDDGNTITDITESSFIATATPESNITLTELTESTMTMTRPNIVITEPSENITLTSQTTEITVESDSLIECDPSSDDCAESTETTTFKGRTKTTGSFASTTVPTTMTMSIENRTATSTMVTDMITESVANVNLRLNVTGSGLTEFGITGVSTTEVGGMDEDTTSEISSSLFTTEVSTTEGDTAYEPVTTICGSSEYCELEFDDRDWTSTSVPEEPSMEKCDDRNETVSCTPASARPRDIIEDVEERSDATEVMMTVTTEMNLSTSSEETIDEIITSSSETSSEETTTGISDATKEYATGTREGITSDLSTATIEVRPLLTTLSSESATKEATSGVPIKVTVPETKLGSDTTMEQTTTGISDATAGVTKWSTTSGREIPSGENTTGMSDATTEEYEGTPSEFYTDGSTTDIGDVAVETTTYITDGSVRETTGTVLSTTVGEFDLGTTAETISNSILTEFHENIQHSTTEGVTETAYTTPDANEDMVTENVYGGTTSTIIDIVTIDGNEEAFTTHVETTGKSEYVSSTCDASTDECETAKPIDVTQITSQPCDPAADSCEFKDDSTASWCDEESGNCFTDSPAVSEISCEQESGDCFIDSSSSSTSTCDEESGDCFTDSPSLSEILCDQESGDCSIDSSSSSTSTCDEESGDCSFDTTCDEESGDCSFDTTSSSIPVCDEESGDCFPDSLSLSEILCDQESGDCIIDSSSSLTPTCDEESSDCSIDSPSLSEILCDQESGDCIIDSSSSLTPTCDEESDDCNTRSTSLSKISCNEESDDCTTDSSSMSTTPCDEETSSSCSTIGDNQRYVTYTDSSEACGNSATGNCTIESKMQDVTDLPPTTSSTPIEVKNVPMTISDVPPTDEGRRSTTVQAASTDPMPKHKLALRIKILLEHIDENKKKQKLVAVEKHLLFNELLHGRYTRTLMDQVKWLNNTVSMRTVQALFNCSTIEKLTGDVGDFATKYLRLHDGIRNVEGPDRNFISTEDTHVRNPQDLSHPENAEVDPNIEISLPGIHTDIHSGLSHVMTRLPLEHQVERRSVEPSEEEISRFRILEVVADPRDERVHARFKRQTIEDLTIDEKDLPEDIAEVDHWSNERFRRAINGGHVRTLTKFTIYKGT